MHPGAQPDDLRPVTFIRDYTEMATGSVLVEFGRTRVLCTASVEGRVPAVAERIRQGLGHRRVLDAAGIVARARSSARPRGATSRGRTQEIQRLIGRSLRAVTDLRRDAPSVQVTVDCDVLQADGGTRTASICGGWIALHDACSRLLASGTLAEHPLARPWPRSRSVSSTARPCSTSTTPRTCAPRST